MRIPSMAKVHYMHAAGSKCELSQTGRGHLQSLSPVTDKAYVQVPVE